MNSIKRTMTSSLAFAILQTASFEAPTNAQSGDYHPGDPIHLGSVHTSYQENTPPVQAAPISSTPTPSQALSTTSSPSADSVPQSYHAGGGKFLQGGVQHSEQLAPVPSGLQVGSTYDQSKLEHGTSTRTWYRVPPWLAGKWEADEQTQTSRLFYKTGITDNKPYPKQAITTVTRGSQRDRLGGLWDCIVLPEFRQVITQKELNNSVFSEQNIIFDSDARVIVRYVYTRTNVDKTTNTIRSVDQVEQFTTYCPGGPDRIRIEFSSKTFDHGGNPIDLAKGWMIAHKVNPFMVSHSDRNNQDVRSAFREFLKTNSMEHLMPLEQ